RAERLCLAREILGPPDAASADRLRLSLFIRDPGGRRGVRRLRDLARGGALMNWLSWIVFLPSAGALLLLAARSATPGDDAAHDRGAKWMTLIIALVTLGLTIGALTHFDPANPGYQLVESRAWTSWLHYRMGVDSISMSLIVLTAALMPICILA